MSIRQGLLALLAEEPGHGYSLRQQFEERTGGTWPLNVGQVYTTLGRLERDGLVEATGAGDGDGDTQRRFAITDAGRAELARWFVTPVTPDSRPRDELAIKLALAVTAPGVDVAAVVQTQRTATLRALQDYTRLKARADTGDATELAWLLVLDNLVFAAEAEVRWLDHCEARLARHRPAPAPAGGRRTTDPAAAVSGDVTGAASPAGVRR